MKEPSLSYPVTVREYRSEPAEALPAITYRLMLGESDGRPSYAIDCHGEGGFLYDHHTFLPDVTSCEKRAEAIFESLCRGAVTPYGLFEAVEEWLASH